MSSFQCRSSSIPQAIFIATTTVLLNLLVAVTAALVILLIHHTRHRVPLRVEEDPICPQPESKRTSIGSYAHPVFDRPQSTLVDRPPQQPCHEISAPIHLTIQEDLPLPDELAYLRSSAPASISPPSSVPNSRTPSIRSTRTVKVTRDSRVHPTSINRSYSYPSIKHATNTTAEPTNANKGGVIAQPGSQDLTGKLGVDRRDFAAVIGDEPIGVTEYERDVHRHSSFQASARSFNGNAAASEPGFIRTERDFDGQSKSQMVSKRPGTEGLRYGSRSKITATTFCSEEHVFSRAGASSNASFD